MDEPDVTKPPGLGWSRVALQVNPWAYLREHRAALASSGEVWAEDEASFNEAMVAAAVGAGISVVGLTDHWSAASSESLRSALTEAGVTVLPGFEAATSEDFHLLCLFPPSTAADQLERYIDALVGNAQLAGTQRRTKLSQFTCDVLTDKVADFGGISIAAHSMGHKGILGGSGQRRVEAWTARHLSAVCTDERQPDEGQAGILANSDHEHRRDRPLPQISARDVACPEQFGESPSWTWMKLPQAGDNPDIIFEGVRQALADPHRISAVEEPAAHPAVWIEEVRWSKSKLFGTQTLRLNPGTNVLIGGRGAGKSSVLASIAWALGLDSVVNPDHAGSVVAPPKDLAGQGTISVVLRVGDEVIRVEREPGQAGPVPEPFAPGDPRPEAFGQGELNTAVKNRDLQLRLVERFDPSLPSLRERLRVDRLRLAKVSEAVEAVAGELSEFVDIDERLNQLDGLLAAAQKAGLNDATQLTAAFRSSSRRVDRLTVGARHLTHSVLPGIQAELLAEIDDLPSLGADDPRPEDKSAVDAAKARFTEATEQHLAALVAAYEQVVNELDVVVREREVAAEHAEAERRAVLESLDDTEAEIPKLEEERVALVDRRDRRDRLRTRRAGLEADWSEIAEQISKLLQLEQEAVKGACKQANAVAGTDTTLVSVTVDPSADDRELRNALLEHKVTDKVIDILVGLLRSEEAPNTMAGLCEMAASGTLPVDDLRSIRSFSTALADGGDAVTRSLSTFALRPAPVIRLNVANGVPPVFKELRELSVGQQATALLLLVLGGGSSPLLIDQPEDDLDNKFVATSLVPLLASAGSQRQIIACTHNANIAVLGGTDLVIEMAATGPDTATVAAQGSLDERTLVEAVTATLEGGRDAFQRRDRRYGSFECSS